MSNPILQINDLTLERDILKLRLEIASLKRELRSYGETAACPNDEPAKKSYPPGASILRRTREFDSKLFPALTDDAAASAIIAGEPPNPYSEQVRNMGCPDPTGSAITRE